jgi:hypothetical protein
MLNIVRHRDRLTPTSAAKTTGLTLFILTGYLSWEELILANVCDPRLKNAVRANYNFLE